MPMLHLNLFVQNCSVSCAQGTRPKREGARLDALFATVFVFQGNRELKGLATRIAGDRSTYHEYHFMNTDKLVQKCVEAIFGVMPADYSIIRLRRAEPKPNGSADYFTRYKVDIAKLDGSGNSPTDVQLFEVSISSNTGQATVNKSVEIPDLN